MSWIRCPECHASDVPRVDGAALLAESPETTVKLRFGSLVVPLEDMRRRSYRCACGWSGISVERIETHRPASLVLRARAPEERSAGETPRAVTST